MGSKPSRHSAKTTSSPNGETIGGSVTRGETKEIKSEKIANKEVEILDETFPFDEDVVLTEESDTEEEEEEEDEEEDEEMVERLRVLDDARKLKQLAEAFLYPERPVVTTDPMACSRNFFNRASAAEVSTEEAEEHARIMEDAKALKKLAVDYLHPENPVVTTDETACARNYFNRASAAEQEDDEEAEARELVMEDLKALKKLAVDYLHPENPVVTTDPMACARNYFGRDSAPEQMSAEEVEAYDLFLVDAMHLKNFAADYLHPERPLVTTDPTAFSRNYFERESAPEQESLEEAEERAEAMKDLKALKQLAIDFAHPELSVFTTDDTACGRLYFNRASAAKQEDDEEAEERELIMEDLKALKKFAVDYLHPELPVETSDETAFARSYFNRASAAEQEDDEEAEERELIMEDLKALKKVAVDYLHPENPVETTDETAFARNFFNRASAEEMETTEETEERDLIMEDLKALKKVAVDYLHPENPVETTDETAFARNYFNRASAEEMETTEEAEERARVLEEMLAFKKWAVDFAHPELPVVASDPSAFGRQYFGRASAPEEETMEDSEERARILDEAMALKKLAVDYAHPEYPVVTTDATACSRNYFNRASAPGHTCISSTREEDVKIVDDNEEDYFLDGDLEFGEFEEDVLMDWKYQVHKLLDASHYSGTVAPSTMKYEHKMQESLDKEEEGKLSRSPSSVMLFQASA